MKRALLILAIVLVVAAIAFFGFAPGYVDRDMNPVGKPPPYEASEVARDFHQSLFVADLHDDLLLWKRDPLKRYDRGHTDVPRLVEGNVGLQVFSAVTKSPWGQNYELTEDGSDSVTLLAVGQAWPVRTWTSQKERALYQAEKLHAAAERSAGMLVVLRTRADLEQFLAQRETEPDLLAGLLAIEGLHALDREIDNLDVLYEAGYRMMAPTHLFDNELGGSNTGVERGGLTAFGRRVVRRMEELGIIVDLAHASDQVVEDVLDGATRPVVVSHTGVQATCETKRNLNDHLLRRIAENGGVIGVGFWDTVLCGDSPADIARAMRHTVAVAGIDHVGLGSDFDGTVRVPFDATGLAQLTEALLKEGFTEMEIRQIMGENVLRLLRATLPAG